MALRTLAAHRLRSFLTVLGIVIGNAAVIAMVGVGQAAQRYTAEQLASLGTNVLFVVPGREDARRRGIEPPATLTWEDAQAIAAQVPTVRWVAAQINESALASYGNRTTPTAVTGTVPDFFRVQSFDLQQGRFFHELDVQRQGRVVVLGSDLAAKLFGDRSPIGERIRLRNLSFEVIGVLAPKGAFLGTNRDDAAYIPLTTMAYQLTGRRSPYGLTVAFISVSARDEASVSAAQFQITNLLRRRHKIVDEDDFYIRTQKEAVAIAGNITGVLTILLAATAGISLLVGGIGIMNIMLVSVTERTQEIGLRKAVGATEGDILQQFLLEAIVLAVAGGILGTAVGTLGLIGIGWVTPLQAQVSWEAVILAVGVSGTIGLVFGVAPAQRAAQLDPIVALRST
ncbi:MAG: ABC transporter permease [Gloeomargarita sp. SKYG116]|nr:ABC transporter permease [Gloeomargarita sp. SKYG116]MDW8400178.1 ABC transporter permease [Gloeomargarita sp. SKYGB_i_bin116]